VYDVNLGDRLVIRPDITYSDTSLLSFDWVIIDLALMSEHAYHGYELNFVFGLQPILYSARLTVTDNSTKMKYFYPFSIYGHTAFNEGIVLLTSKDGQAELSFIKPDGVVQENIYELIAGEPLPTGPVQIVALRHQNYVGKPYLGYWIICSDKQNPGVQIDANSFSKIKDFRENFFSTTEGEISAQRFVARDDATMAGIINGKFYVGAFATYYLSPVYGYFGNPIPGNYQLASILAVAPDGTFVWSYDKERKSLVCFIPPGGMFFDATSMPGPPAVFNPANINLDLITLHSSNSGFYLLGRDESGVYELKFSTGGQMVISQYKRPFVRPDLIKDDTKWVLLPSLEVFFFSSGNKVYRYNPLNESVEELPLQLSGNVSMLKLGDSNRLVIGVEGNLHWVDVSVGQNFSIEKTVRGFSGEPVDIYSRKDEN